MIFANPFTQPGVWLKANLHTHTTLSDGDRPSAARVEQYAAAGYQVLAITDHRVVAPVEALQRQGLTLIRSLEAHPVCLDGPVYHLVCLNVSSAFRYDESLRANDLIAQVRADGGEVIVAHPYWCGHGLDHILALENVMGMEVYNTTCSRIGKADSTLFWDYMLAAGRFLPAVAVDDTHGPQDALKAWTMIRAASPAVADVMAALKAGSYYASCGPEFADVHLADGVLDVRCSPVHEIRFVCRGACGSCLWGANGGELTEGRFKVPASAGYVRVQIVDRQGRSAWTNPWLV